MQLAKSLTTFELVNATDCTRDHFKSLLPVCPECGMPVFLSKGSTYNRGATPVSIQPYWSHFQAGSDRAAADDCKAKVKNYGDADVRAHQERGQEQRMAIMESFLVNLLSSHSYTWTTLDLLKAPQRLLFNVPRKSFRDVGLALSLVYEAQWGEVSRGLLEQHIRRAAAELFKDNEFVGQHFRYLNPAVTGLDLPINRLTWSLRTEQHIQTCTDLFVVFCRSSPAVRNRFLWLIFYKQCATTNDFLKSFLRECKTARLTIDKPRKAAKRSAGMGMGKYTKSKDRREVASQPTIAGRYSGTDFLFYSFLTFFCRELVRTDWFMFLKDVVNEPERSIVRNYSRSDAVWYGYFEKDRQDTEGEVTDKPREFDPILKEIMQSSREQIVPDGFHLRDINIVATISGMYFGETFSIVHESIMHLL